MTNKPRFVIDTNLMVSAALRKNSVPRQVINWIWANGKIVYSVDTIAELFDVLQRPKFDKYVTRTERFEFMSEIAAISELVRVTKRYSVCRDPKDDKIEPSIHNRHEMLMLREHITLPVHQIAEFCKQHHIRKLSIFGSALRDDFHSESDLDLLVESEPTCFPYG